MKLQQPTPNGYIYIYTHEQVCGLNKSENVSLNNVNIGENPISLRP